MTNNGFSGYPSTVGSLASFDARYTQVVTAEGASATSAVTWPSSPRIMPGGRLVGLNSATMTAGRLFLAGFTAPGYQSVSQIAIRTRGTAAAGTTLARMGLYSVDASNYLTLLARTASDTALCTVTFTNYVKSFDTTGGYAAAVPLQPGQRYALAVLFAGSSTAPVVYGGGLASEMALVTPFLAASVSAQSDLAATYASSSLAADGTLPALQLY